MTTWGDSSSRVLSKVSYGGHGDRRLRSWWLRLRYNSRLIAHCSSHRRRLRAASSSSFWLYTWSADKFRETNIESAVSLKKRMDLLESSMLFNNDVGKSRIQKKKLSKLVCYLKYIKTFLIKFTTNTVLVTNSLKY